MKLKKLTKRQLDIMKILWSSSKPLISSDFIKIDPSLNINTVQSALRMLLSNGYIEVADIVYSGTVLSRSYTPLISAEQYIRINFSGITESNFSSNLISHYIEQEDDLQVINRLENLLKKRREELEKK